MYKENLFNLIRQEEVVIWAGAGISLYAGYPSGEKMKEILLENLSDTERKDVNKNLPLPDLAEEFYRIKGNNKNSLIRSLNKTFVDFKPTSTSCHDKIASVPHFKTIITTNYDKLFENAYSENGQLIYSPDQIPYIDKNKTSIFKIHGDLTEPNSIIITKSDYIRFFTENTEYNILWTLIKERISTNCILFMGYNLEDHNISAVFDRITNVLKDNQKECFFIAPNIPKTKENYLVGKGIHYINMTAEKFVDELILNIKANLTKDFEENKVSSDTFHKCLAYHKILPRLDSDGTSLRLESLRKLDDSVEEKITFSINNASIYDNIKKLMDRSDVVEVDFDKDEILNLEYQIGGFKYDRWKNSQNLKLQTSPSYSTTIDISFDNGFEYLNIPTKSYTGLNNNKLVEYHLNFTDVIVKIQVNKLIKSDVNFTFHYQLNKICNKVNNLIQFYKLIENVSKSENLSIYEKGICIFSHQIPYQASLLEDAQLYLQYLSDLHKIESFFKIRFQNFEIIPIKDSDYNIVQKLIMRINGESKKKRFTDIAWINLLPSDINSLHNIATQMNEHPIKIVTIKDRMEIVELYGHKIELGYEKIQIDDANIDNLGEILEGKSNTANISSKSREIIYSYVDKINEKISK